MKPQISVFDIEPFGHEIPSGLSLRVKDKAEWLSRNENYSVISFKEIVCNPSKCGVFAAQAAPTSEVNC
jgi:hypothetical protein